MHFELTIAVHKRKCHWCNQPIEKQTKHFVITDWQERSDFPVKRNVCLACLPRQIDSKFLKYLEELLTQLKSMQHIATQIDTPKLDKNKTYSCERCQVGVVSWSEVFAKFQCGDCEELYETYDLERLTAKSTI